MRDKIQTGKNINVELPDDEELCELVKACADLLKTKQIDITRLAIWTYCRWLLHDATPVVELEPAGRIVWFQIKVPANLHDSLLKMKLLPKVRRKLTAEFLSIAGQLGFDYLGEGPQNGQAKNQFSRPSSNGQSENGVGVPAELRQASPSYTQPSRTDGHHT